MTITLSIPLPAYVVLCLVLLCSAIMHFVYAGEHLDDSEFESILGATMGLIIVVALIALITVPSLPPTTP